MLGMSSLSDARQAVPGKQACRLERRRFRLHMYRLRACYLCCWHTSDGQRRLPAVARPRAIVNDPDPKIQQQMTRKSCSFCLGLW